MSAEAIKKSLTHQESEDIGQDLSGLSPLERNPLLYPPHFESEEAMAGFKYVVDKMIEKLGGVGVELETILVRSYYDRTEYRPRLVARFSVKNLSEKQLEQLQEIAGRMYPEKVSTVKNPNGSTAGSVLYPKLGVNGSERDPSKIGWYFGPESGTPGRLHCGLLVFRSIPKRDVASGVKARRDTKWFTQEHLRDNSGKKVETSYIIEIREESLFQTDLAEAIVLTSLALASKELPPKDPGLLCDIYHYMNRMGLKGDVQIPGLESQAAEINEALFLPLANQDLAQGLTTVPRAITLIGQVGTGKTQLIRYFMNQDLDVMMVAVNALDFESDLQIPDKKKIILPRIRYVAGRTGKAIVLIIEDIERLANEDNPVSSTLLNELAGLFKNNYYIICTTNHPEQFNHQLLESERLGGRLIFCPLPNSTARRYILDVHLPLRSKGLGIELFDPEALSRETGTHFETADQARRYLLDALAASTNGFTPRYLQDLCTRAKDIFMARIAREVGRFGSLTEADLKGRSFSLDDWLQAFGGVLSVYNWKERVEEDERLRRFTHPGEESSKPEVGFHLSADQGQLNAFQRLVSRGAENSSEA